MRVMHGWVLHTVSVKQCVYSNIMHGLGLMHTNKLWHTSGARLQTNFTRPFRSKFTPFVPISVQAAPKPAPERSSRPKRHGPHRLRPHEKITAAPEVQRLNKVSLTRQEACL